MISFKKAQLDERAKSDLSRKAIAVRNIGGFELQIGYCDLDNHAIDIAAKPAEIYGFEVAESSEEFRDRTADKNRWIDCEVGSEIVGDREKSLARERRRFEVRIVI
ncbi:hypothetical protein U1Q18_006818 [Sarracenia purpurea var. burkii]